MKRTFLLYIGSAFNSLIIITFLISTAQATLIDRGEGLIYSTELGVTFFQDTNSAGSNMTLVEAHEWVSNLDHMGYGDWRLPLHWNSPQPRGSEVHDLVVQELGWVSDTETGHFADYHNRQNGPFLNLFDPTYSSEPFIWLYDPAGYPLEYGFSWNPDFGNDLADTIEFEFKAWAVRDGDYGPSVSNDQTYLSDPIQLGEKLTFDYFWDMGIEPTEFNMDVLLYSGTNFETFGLEFNFKGSSKNWSTAMAYVPEWARGREAQILFGLGDYGQTTNPTVYLNNISSNAVAGVPEPTTLLLMGAGFVGLVGVRMKKKRSEIFRERA